MKKKPAIGTSSEVQGIKYCNWCYYEDMTAEADALASLRATRLLDVLRWSAATAFALTEALYDEDCGHDQGVVGYLNFKHYKDSMDRATSSGRFAVVDGVAGTGADVLARGLSADALQSMPLVAPQAIERVDYKQSPGWAAGPYRVLLQSYAFGHVDEIVWTERSRAKARVASQYCRLQDALFDPSDMGIEILPGIPDDDNFDGITLVAAHAFNVATRKYEAYVGQSRNPDSADASCWYWRTLILEGGGSAGDRGYESTPIMPESGASPHAEDVPVRFRIQPGGQSVRDAGE